MMVHAIYILAQFVVVLVQRTVHCGRIKHVVAQELFEFVFLIFTNFQMSFVTIVSIKFGRILHTKRNQMLRTISKQIYRSFVNVPNIIPTNLFPNSLLKSRNGYLTQQRYKFKRVGDRPLGQQLQILDSVYQSDEWTNVPDKVIELIGRDLYRTPGNPIYLISETLRQNYADHHCYEFTNPVVDVWSNFDSILVPEDHISRKRTDTFYVDAKHVLRAHTSAHQSCCFEKCFQDGKDGKFIVIGDVYRRDEVNRTHHAAFHQCEVVQLYQNNDSEVWH